MEANLHEVLQFRLYKMIAVEERLLTCVVMYLFSAMKWFTSIFEDYLNEKSIRLFEAS